MALGISAQVLTCYRLTKDRATLFRPETTVASFLHLMVLFFKVKINHPSYMYILKQSYLVYYKNMSKSNRKASKK